MNAPEKPRVLALDLSLTRTGYATPDGNAGVLRPPFDSKEPERRIEWIRDEIMGGLIGEWECDHDDPVDVVVMEGFSFGSKGRALDQIHGLGWVVRLALREMHVPLVVVPPSTLKRYATGRGNADKQAMQMAAVKRLGYDDDKPDDNVVDALWLRAFALDAYGHAEVQVPKAQREASIAALSWPRLREVVPS